MPKEGITIALMIYLDNTIGSHEIFQTVGDHSDHNEGKYQNCCNQHVVVKQSYYDVFHV